MSKNNFLTHHTFVHFFIIKRNYWNEDYEDEAIVSDYWTLVGEIPVSTCEMIGLAYAKRNFKDGEVKAMFLVSSDENNPTIAYFKDNHETKELSVIYLASLKIPNTPPYCMTGQQLIDSITEADGRVFFKSFINQAY